MKKLLTTLFLSLITAGASSAATIVYTFETSGNISGTGASQVYSAPDTNTFGTGISVGNFELSDLDNYNGYIGSRGGGNEAWVADRGSASTVEFTITVASGYTADFTNITFDTSYFTSLTGNTLVDWTFSTIVGAAPATNATTGGFTHNGGTNYQSPAGANINLTGLTGLTGGTTVTFQWLLNANKNHDISTRSIGIDDINLTGAASAIPEPSTFAILLGGIGMLALLRRRRA